VRLTALAALVAGGGAVFVALCQFTGAVDFRRILRRPKRTAAPDT
jgi:hypothetical protein